MDELENLGQTIASALGAAVTAHQVVLGELSITTTAADLIKVMRFLRDDERCQFVSFLDVTAVDCRAASGASTSSITCSRRGRTAESG